MGDWVPGRYVHNEAVAVIESAHDTHQYVRAYDKTLCTNDKAHALIDDLREEVDRYKGMAEGTFHELEQAHTLIDQGGEEILRLRERVAVLERERDALRLAATHAVDFIESRYTLPNHDGQMIPAKEPRKLHESLIQALTPEAP